MECINSDADQLLLFCDHPDHLQRNYDLWSVRDCPLCRKAWSCLTVSFLGLRMRLRRSEHLRRFLERHPCRVYMRRLGIRRTSCISWSLSSWWICLSWCRCKRRRVSLERCRSVARCSCSWRLISRQAWFLASRRRPKGFVARGSSFRHRRSRHCKVSCNKDSFWTLNKAKS